MPTHNLLKNQPNFHEAHELAQALFVTAAELEMVLDLVVNDFDLDEDHEETLDAIWAALDNAREATKAANRAEFELRQLTRPETDSTDQTKITVEAAE